MSDSIFNFADANNENTQKGKTTYLDRMDLSKKELFVKNEEKREKESSENNKDIDNQKEEVEEVGKSSVPSVKKSNFTHLHLHTEYSLLDGACHIKKLPKLLKSMGMEACAITDHGNMFGVIEFYKEMKANGIKPIIGCEVYVAPPGKTRFDKDGQFYGESDKKYNHLILLVKNQKGYENLMKIVSIGWTEGFYYKPRVDIDILKKYNEGLVCLSACLGGILNQELLYGTYEQAKKYALEYKEIYDDDFYVEIQDHGIREQKINNPKLIQIAKETGLKVVATCDSHYLTKDDYYSHELLLAIQTGATIKDENRFSFPQNEFYVKSEKEMLEVFSYIPEAIYNTQEIVDKCNFEMKFGDIHLPDYEYPAGFQSETAFFHDLVKKGLRERYGKSLTKEHIERAKYELSVIEKMHFVGYFNIVSDFIRWAKEENIPVGPGRGCTCKDTQILTENGYKPITDISIGDMVYTHTGELKKVLKTFVYNNDETLIKPCVYYGDKDGDYYTSDHKLLVLKAEHEDNASKIARGYRFKEVASKKLQWVPASDIEIGDMIAIPSLKTPLPDMFIDNQIDLAYFAGKECQISSSKITESVPVNRPYKYSIRDVAKNTNVGRNTLSSIFTKNRNLNKSTREKISNYIKNDFKSIEDWRLYVEDNKNIVRKTNRYIPINEDFLYFLGLMVGDGYVRKDSDRDVFLIRNNKEDNEAEIKQMLINIFGNDVSYSRTLKKNSPVITYRIFSSALCMFFKKFCWKDYRYTPNTKNFHDFILNIDKDLKLAFIRGLIDSDGYEDNNFVYTSTSKKLIDKLRLLLLTLNIPNGIVKRDAYKTVIKGKEYQCQDSWQVTFPKALQMPRLSIGEQDEDYVYKRVYDIKYSGDYDCVYDITVEDDHSYVTSNFAAHNSAAGSIIAYATHITDVDPIKYGLLFERFLNPERISFPDIDVDFCYDRRHEVIDYVTEKYGKERVSQIVTFGTMAARMAIRDVGRALDIPLYVVDRVAKAVPNELKITIKKALEISKDLQDEYKSSPQIKELIDEAIKIEGSPRHTSKHAAGVVIADDDISKYAPLMTADGEAVVQFPMTELEEIGLIKMDVRIV